MANDFPATENTPGQDESRLAYAEMARCAAQGKLPWWNDFVGIKMMYPQFKNWRIWALVAWDSQSAAAKAEQGVTTQEDFAIKVLGLKTDRSIRHWKDQFGDQMEEAKAWAQAAPLLEHRRDFYDALAQVASDPHPRAHQDRKLAFEMLGDYTPRQKIEADVELPQLPGVLDDLLGKAYGDHDAGNNGSPETE